jgi:hypothetical protein
MKIENSMKQLSSLFSEALLPGLTPGAHAEPIPIPDENPTGQGVLDNTGGGWLGNLDSQL